MSSAILLLCVCAALISCCRGREEIVHGGECRVVRRVPCVGESSDGEGCIQVDPCDIAGRYVLRRQTWICDMDYEEKWFAKNGKDAMQSTFGRDVDTGELRYNDGAEEFPELTKAPPNAPPSPPYPLPRHPRLSPMPLS
ncbi:hypothetical protein CYMTET_26439 [Cymbomonas tetramitiformis]|uniref:Uncharacterized protein n=1 Tax=Cymbomonas tetramitiformis TaxID=36881 RepID=A0AAE0KY80_9CHLO|nr:hypothetical protein CYMTET_26439 [Cymbomonas tetramitiformis]